MTFLDNSRKIYVAGANGMVGSAICRLIESNNFSKEKKNNIKNNQK